MTDELSGTALCFNTYTSRRVSVVYENENNTLTDGQGIIFTYGKDYTNIQSSGKDDIIETNDDILTHYCFDHACRCVCSYSTDLTGHSVYGINSVEYEAEASDRNNASDNSKKRNKVKSAAYVSDSTPNLLLNPTFRWSSSGNIPDWVKTAGVTVNNSAWNFNMNPAGWDYSIKIPESSSTAYVYQSLILPAGTYTLSADVMCYEQNNLTARLKVTDGSGTATLGQKEIRGEETSDYSDVSLTSLTFIVPGNNTSVRVYLTVEGTSSYSNGDYVILKQMSLTGSAGSGLVSVVDYGNFDDSVHSGSSVASRWTSSVPGVPVQIVSDTDFGGKCLRMNGTGVNNTSIPGTTHYSDYTVSQVLYEATEDEYSHYCSNTSQYFLMQKQFRVTARAKASGAIPSDQSAFEIRLTFTLSTGSNSSGTETKTEKIPFSKYTDKWQYVSEIVEVPHGKFIRKITVECVFSNQYGYALFDDISVCFAGNDENSTRYIYCDNGNIKAITNGYATTWYIYGNGSHYAGENDVIAEIKPRYATIYTYSARHKVSQTHVYTYPTDYGAEENYGFTPDNTSGYTLRSTTEYTYNTFGQVTSTDTVIPAAGNAIDQRLSTSTTYNTPASASAPAAHIFGSVRQQTDDSGNVTEYFYDNGTGNVKAVLDPLGNGVCYEYDHLGRITSVRPCERSGSTYYEIYESAEVEYVYDGTDLRKIDTVSTDYYVTYDKFGNKTKVAFDESGTVKLAEYRYNGHNGKLYEVDYANGKRVKYLYDTLERVSEIQYNSGVNGAFVTAYKFNYDADGHLYLSEDLLTGTDTYRRYSYNGRLNEYASTVQTGLHSQNVSSTSFVVLYDEEGRVQAQFGTRDYLYGSATFTDGFSNSYGYDDNKDGSLISATSNYSGLRYNQGYAYDYFGRITREESEITDEEGINYYERKQIKYEVVSSDGDDLTSTRISGVDTTYTGNASSGNFTKNYRYTYDANGNITEIRINNVLKYSYEYDEFGQLTRENNADTNQTVIYIYDNSGNIREKRTYTYTVASSLSGLEYTPVYYTYDEPEAYTDGYFEGLWGDLLTGYDGQEITYDNVGNPLTIGDGITLEWTQGRRLARYNLYGDTDIEFTYDADGIRTRKTVEGITHYYTLDGTKILSEEWTTGTGSNTCQHLMIYVYDAYGSPIGFRYRKSTEPEGVFHEYLYGKNIQGDILYVLGLNGTLYASYVYDAWGKQTVTYSNTGNDFGNAPGVQYNPFTYRGYYYDSETGLYYLNSRYYNPEWGRFLNPDCYLNANGDILGFNMFAYCGNNPVMGYDPSGNFPILSLLIVAGAVLCAVCLAGCSTNPAPTESDDLENFNHLSKSFEDELLSAFNDVYDTAQSDPNGFEYGTFIVEENGMYYHSTVYNSRHSHGLEYDKATRSINIDTEMVSHGTIVAFIHYHPAHNENLIWNEVELRNIRTSLKFDNYVIDCDRYCYIARPDMYCPTDPEFLYVLP